MKYGSVCSGIEAATVAWEPLGWEPAFYSEIEKFPNAVLQHHYPHVPNHGNMTRYQEWPDGSIDLLVGGTPCQSFSIAGLRKGLDDPRGNLALTFLAIADKYKPGWVVWENVPGVLSDSTKALQSMLDGMEEMGYIVDIDILDAQFHGVPQRRRRVFICGLHRNHLAQMRTDTSALIITQCWQEILHGILAVRCRASGKEPENSDLAYLSRGGIQRRMKLFGLLGESDNYRTLQENLVEALRRHPQEPNILDVCRGAQDAGHTQAALLMGSKQVRRSLLTEESLSEALDASYEVMKSFIMSTGTSSITTSQIYTCSLAALLIAKLIVRLNQSSPPFWSAASSSLIGLQEYMNYARQASSDLFVDMDRIPHWLYFVREAEPTINALGSIGVQCFGEVFTVSQSLSGNPPPCREARKGFAPAIAPSLRTQGNASHRLDSDAYVASSGNVARCLNAGACGRLDAESETLIAFGAQNSCTSGLSASHDHTPTLDKSKVPAVAFGVGESDSVAHCLRSGASKADKHESTTYVAGSSVRRLTPVECERLQGFPDNYTDIKPNNKPTPDGPRYKALGNSMAVPVMRWIGERIQMVEEIKREMTA